MKKKLLILVLSAVLLLSACATEKQPDIQDDKNENDVTTQAVDTHKDDAPENNSVYDWDMNVIEFSGVNKNNESQNFRISFPTDVGYITAFGKMSKAMDGTYVILGAQTYDCELICNSAEDVLEAFESQVEAAALEKINDASAKNLTFSIDSKKTAEVAGLPACKYEGTHTFTINAGTFTQYFEAYAVELSNGGYAYWLVFDNSEDQSLKDVVRYDVETMAQTFEEY